MKDSELRKKLDREKLLATAYNLSKYVPTLAELYPTWQDLWKKGSQQADDKNYLMDELSRWSREYWLSK